MTDFSHLSLTEKRELLAKLLQKPLKDKIFPLSFAQQRLWFLDKLEPMNSAYNISTGFLLEGKLNVEYLEQSINEVIKRHESLRTSFETISGQPKQIIKEARNLSLTKVNLGQTPLNQQQEEIAAIALKDAKEPFELSEWPLLKVKLLYFSENKHVLLLVI
ncbi:MAG: amino acid adenylation protein, partial [bacterium]